MYKSYKFIGYSIKYEIVVSPEISVTTAKPVSVKPIQTTDKKLLWVILCNNIFKGTVLLCKIPSEQKKNNVIYLLLDVTVIKQRQGSIMIGHF